MKVVYRNSLMPLHSSMKDKNKYPIRGSCISDLIIGASLFQAPKFMDWVIQQSPSQLGLSPNTETKTRQSFPFCLLPSAPCLLLYQIAKIFIGIVTSKPLQSRSFGVKTYFSTKTNWYEISYFILQISVLRLTETAVREKQRTQRSTRDATTDISSQRDVLVTKFCFYTGRKECLRGVGCEK